MELRTFNTTPEINEDIKEIVESVSVKTKDSENIHKNHRARLKSQFLNNGFESLTDIQKLELMLFYAIPQKDTNPLAHALLKEFGSLANVLAADINQLIKVNGIKENTAILLKLINDMLGYVYKPTSGTYIHASAQAKEYASKLYLNVDVEQFYVICLTNSNMVKKCVMIKSGKVDEVNVQIRNITQVALESKCSRIIVSHNHPAGKAAMSDEDARFTYSLLCSCLLNSIDVVDHIIVGTDKTVSLGEQNIMQKLKQRAVKTILLSSDTDFMLAEPSSPYIINEEN